MKYSYLCILAAILLTATNIDAQRLDLENASHKCVSVEMHQHRQQQDASILGQAAFEDWMRDKRVELLANGNARSQAVQTLPVVVHVIHNGEALGIAPNISDAQILSQIQVLNEDFRKIAGSPGDNTHPDGADMELEFVLAKVDDQGKATDGINRVEWGAFDYDPGFMDDVVKPATIWNPDYFLNIWVVSLVNPNSSTSILLGYAQFPKANSLGGLPSNPGSRNTDGIVINARYFGSAALDDGSFDTASLNRGRTLTHELGHFFGLRHIWGDAGDGQDGCLIDDYCTDTPDQESSTNGCPTTRVSCDSADMFENYMDYSNDVCMNIFTSCQVGRKDVVIANSLRRYTLPTSPALTANSGFAISGQVVDMDSGNPIPNARLRFDGDFVPEVTADASGNFSLPNFYAGRYDVIVGAWGFLTTEVEDVDIDATTGALTFQISKGWEDSFALDLGWEISGDSEVLFEIAEPIASYFSPGSTRQYDPGNDISSDIGSKCFMTGSVGGLGAWSDVDSGVATVTSPEFDLSNYSYPVVSLYTWFINKRVTSSGPAPDDMFTIKMSNGTETVTVFEQDGSNNDDQAEWVLREFIVSDYLTPTNQMKLIIETSDNVTSTEGHIVDAAIDVFSVKEGSTASEDILEVNKFNISPNPSSGILNLAFETSEAINLDLRIVNILGQEVFGENLGRVSGNMASEIDLKAFSKGVYLVQLRAGNKVKTKKIVLY